MKLNTPVPTLRVALLGAAALFVTACGPDLPAFDQVQADFAAPSASVSAATMPAIFGAGVDTASTNASTETGDAFARDEAGWAMTMAQDLAYGQRKDYLLEFDCKLDVKVTATGKPKKISATCDSAALSGKITIEYDWDGADLVAWFIHFENWCAADSCADGWLGFKTTDEAVEGGWTQKLLVTARLQRIEAGVTTDSIDWAMRYLRDGTGGQRVEWLAYADVDGVTHSAVLSATLFGDQSGNFSVRGANGDFTCDWDATGSAGVCTGSQGNTFEWTYTSA